MTIYSASVASGMERHPIDLTIAIDSEFQLRFSQSYGRQDVHTAVVLLWNSAEVMLSIHERYPTSKKFLLVYKRSVELTRVRFNFSKLFAEGVTAIIKWDCKV
jgi:hypothetical protein